MCGCVEDWAAMRQKLNDISEKLTRNLRQGLNLQVEVVAFLNWINTNHLHFLVFGKSPIRGRAKRQLQIDGHRFRVLRDKTIGFDGLRNLGLSRCGAIRRDASRFDPYSQIQ